MLMDTARCGSGRETVSYASLDPNLALARGNVCLAVKIWAAYLGLAQLYNRLGRTNGHYAMSIDSASAVAAVLAERADEDGLLPASLDHESPARLSRSSGTASPELRKSDLRSRTARASTPAVTSSSR